jgi:hypothetical protein
MSHDNDVVVEKGRSSRQSSLRDDDDDDDDIEIMQVKTTFQEVLESHDGEAMHLS